MSGSGSCERTQGAIEYEDIHQELSHVSLYGDKAPATQMLEAFDMLVFIP